MLVSALLIPVSGATPIASASTLPIVKGDLAVSLLSGEVDEYTPSGTFVQKLMDSTNGLGLPTGSAFDGSGNLYVTDFSNDQILKRDALTGTVSVFANNGSLGNGHVFDAPESIVFNRGYSQAVVSDANRGGPGGGINVVNVPTGSGAAFYPLSSSSGSEGTGESDWLAFDRNSNLFMTNENPTQGVMQVNTTTGDVVQPSFAPNLPTYGYALSFDKNGNLWVGDTNQVLEFDSTGAQLKAIANPSFSQIFAAVFDPSGNTFYAGDLSTGTIFSYDLSGNLLASFTAGSGISGLSVAGAAVPPNAGRYVALGDSYSSGEGAAAPPVTSESNPNFDPTTDTSNNQCHRSYNAYPELLRSALTLPDTSFAFHACSGALLSEMTNQLNKDNPNSTAKKYAGQWGEPAQLDHLAPATGPPDPTIDLVTLSIGGNDAGFVGALSDCVIGLGNGDKDHCTPGFMQSRLNRALEVLKGTAQVTVRGRNVTIQRDPTRETVWSGGTWDLCLNCPLGARHFGPRGLFVHDDGYVVDVPSVHSLLQQIHSRAPNTKIRLLLYPKFFPAQPPARCIVGQFQARAITHSYTIDRQAMTTINALADQLDDTLIGEVKLAQQAGIDVQSVDPRTAFIGHGVACIGDPQDSTSDPWINGALIQGSFLPFASPSPYSFHPNTNGQQAFESAVQSSL